MPRAQGSERAYWAGASKRLLNRPKSAQVENPKVRLSWELQEWCQGRCRWPAPQVVPLTEVWGPLRNPFSKRRTYNGL